ncbi:Rv1678 family membrane protein [Prauserella muralis]|uniref:Rv1678 family membrane protein n=1 Tax=Prauserella muralis TaxID=588067 RepID=UPI000DD3F65F|nr:TQO small subunit DoxD [Prauserella muralis]
MDATTAAPRDGARTLRGSVRWLPAVLRIGVAFLWIQNAAWKVPPTFGEAGGGGLYHFTRFAVDRPVWGPYAWLVEHVVLPNFTFFGWVTLLVEAALGAFLLVGLFTRFWAVVGLGQTLVITLSVLNAPHEWHWSFYLMFLAHLALLTSAAGHAFGVDGALATGRAARAPLALGIGALLCTVFALSPGSHGRTDFVQLQDAGLYVVLALGALAVVAGALRSRLLTFAAGAGFAGAAVVQLLQAGRDTNWLAGNGSTVALLAGFGAGLLAVGLARRR